MSICHYIVYVLISSLLLTSKTFVQCAGSSRYKKYFNSSTPSTKMSNNGHLALGFLKTPYKVVKANSGGIRFTIRSSRAGIQIFCLHLLKKECSHEAVYTINLSENSTLYDPYVSERIDFKIPNFNNQNIYDFWITWFNDVISLGKFNEPALLMYSEVNTNIDKMIGFVKFETCSQNGRIIKWNVESEPFIYAPMTAPKQVDGGELRWVEMNSSRNLPIDALIGGLEEEPLYIARAHHRGSLCPGKYVRSERHAFIPWGHQEIPKNDFEILCGYDARWVKCSDNHIPENAFIGGYSEVREEPLYIGRAWVKNNLIVGKVHMLYKTCYVPYRDREVERSEYEILVVANKTCRGEKNNSLCYMKMCMQPCS